ncbi:MAG: Gfo/Idh/MocA family oxidoreductase [Anaerolineales bacterium]|nr:Gfo/Idh/MocA family oxidoreductase [Anaerolineales bacterium]
MSSKVGFIGLGIMGQRMLAAVQAHPEFNIGHVWDLAPAAVANVTGRYPQSTPATSAASLISSPEVDVVYIATPPATHLDYVLQALAAGKAIFCEKPLATDLTRAREIVARVQAAGVVNAINFPFGQALHVQTLYRLLQAGQAGAIDRIEMRFHFPQWPRTWQMGAASWLAGRVEGGFTREVVSHFIYLTLRLLGPMQIDNARVGYPADLTLTENRLSARLTAAGVPVYIQGGVGGQAPDFNEWCLYGQQRSFRIQDWGRLQQSDGGPWQDLPPDTTPSGRGQETLSALAAQLRGEPAYLPTLAEGLAVQEIVEGLLAKSN